MEYENNILVASTNSGIHHLIDVEFINDVRSKILHSYNIREALHNLFSYQIDLIIIDHLSLEYIGQSLFANISENGLQIPVIIVPIESEFLKIKREQGGVDLVLEKAPENLNILREKAFKLINLMKSTV